MTKIKIGVIFGGQSSEHEVSIVSAQAVMDALDKKKYKIIPIKISKTGQWSHLRFARRNRALPCSRTPKCRGSYNWAHANKSYLPAGKALLQIGHTRIKIDNPTKFLNKLDIVFPLIHGTTGEDGGLQGFLEFSNIPYVGAGVMDSALGMDKATQKQLFIHNKLPTVKFLGISNFKFLISNTTVLRRIKSELGYPCFIKPMRSGSSVGISRVDRAENLQKALNLANKYDSKVIIEAAVEESREFECAVLGNENPKISVVGEVISSNNFYDYNAKYIDGKSQTIVPAKISKQLSNKIQNLAIRAYKVIDCNGMARADFLYDTRKKKLYINELNTIPGFTSISMYPKLWEASGLSYPRLLDELVKLGFERFEKQNKLKNYLCELVV